MDIDHAVDGATEDLAETEDEISAYTGISDYDTVYAAIARKSMRRAEMLDQNPSIAKAIKKIMIGIETFASLHRCDPQDLVVRASMSFEGRIVIAIDRR